MSDLNLLEDQTPSLGIDASAYPLRAVLHLETRRESSISFTMPSINASSIAETSSSSISIAMGGSFLCIDLTMANKAKSTVMVMIYQRGWLVEAEAVVDSDKASTVSGTKDIVLLCVFCRFKRFEVGTLHFIQQADLKIKSTAFFLVHVLKARSEKLVTVVPEYLDNRDIFFWGHVSHVRRVTNWF